MAHVTQGLTRGCSTTLCHRFFTFPETAQFLLTYLGSASITQS